MRIAALLVVLAWLGLGSVGGQSLGKLSGLQENGAGAFLPADTESSLAAIESRAFASGEGLPAFLIVARDGGVTPADLGVLQAFAPSIPSRPLEGGGTVADLLASPTTVAIPSEDGIAAMIPITLDAEKAGGQINGESAITVFSNSLDDAVESTLRSTGLTANVTGPGGYAADFGRAFAGIDGILLLVALVVVFVILVLVYRSPFLPLVVLTSAIMGLSAAGLVVYELAKRGTLEVSGQSQGILAILVVGAATDYALLVVARYREELHHTDSTWQAMKLAWRGTVEPIAASGITVILGLLCLLLASVTSTRSLGPISAIGIVGALFGALTFLPALLLLIGRRVFWPRIPRHDDRAPADILEGNGVWVRLARFIGQRPRATWVATTAILLVLAAFAPTLKASGLANDEVFRITVQAVEGEKMLDAHFPSGSGSPFTIAVPEASASAVIDAVTKVDGVAEASVAQTQGVPNVVDGRVLVEGTLNDPATSIAAQDTVALVRDAARAVDPGLKVGGLSAETLDTAKANARDIRVVFPAIIGVVLIVLILLLRALVAPIVMMLANILSFAATLGVSALVFNHVFKFPNSDPSTPLYAFVFLIALGVDYSIFLMTRVREETPKHGTRKAALIGLAVTGGVITSAGVVLAATFSALFVIPLVFMAQIGFFVAFGVLLDTLVVRSLLLPGLTHELGRKMWWPGKLAREAKD